jgi:hypothetical protein
MKSRRVFSVLGSVIAAIAASAGIAMALQSSSSIGLSKARESSVNLRATSIPVGLAASYTVLRRASDAADSLPAGGVATVTQGLGQTYGINPALSRLAGTPDGSGVWIVPGASGTCIYDALSGGGACGSNAEVEAHGAALLLVPPAGGAPIMVGVLPSGATVAAANADGASVPVTVSGTAFRLTGSSGGTVTISGLSGNEVLPIPTGSATG